MLWNRLRRRIAKGRRAANAAPDQLYAIYRRPPAAAPAVDAFASSVRDLGGLLPGDYLGFLAAHDGLYVCEVKDEAAARRLSRSAAGPNAILSLEELQPIEAEDALFVPILKVEGGGCHALKLCGRDAAVVAMDAVQPTAKTRRIAPCFADWLEALIDSGFAPDQL